MGIEISNILMEEKDLHVQQWKVKRLIKMLEKAKPSGSVITLMMPPKEQIGKTSKMLVEEYGKASNVKSQSNKKSIQESINSTKERLKLYNKVPPNGLIIYVGRIMTEN